MMKLHQFNRKIHYWGALLCAAPLFLVILTGLLLLLKKQLPWVQPPTQKVEVEVISTMVTPDQMLIALKGVPHLYVDSWHDIERIDIQPQKGVAKLMTGEHIEVQLNLTTGRILQVEPRRSDWIENLHDGSYFGDAVKYGIFLPAALILLFLWCTGLYLFALPFYRRLQKKQR